jgi:hypothetical protein
MSKQTRKVEVEIKTIGIDDVIGSHPEIQARVKLDEQVVAEYAELYRAGVELPPIRVVRDDHLTTLGGAKVFRYWPWDGFHRVAASRQAGRTTIQAEIRSGELEDAKWLALSANTTHGLRRTNEDKRRAVELALKMKPKLSDRTIAKHCGVHHQMVATVRRSLDESSSESTERIDKNGRTLNVATIGKSVRSKSEAKGRKNTGKLLADDKADSIPEQSKSERKFDFFRHGDDVEQKIKAIASTWPADYHRHLANCLVKVARQFDPDAGKRWMNLTPGVERHIAMFQELWDSLAWQWKDDEEQKAAIRQCLRQLAEKA